MPYIHRRKVMFKDCDPARIETVFTAPSRLGDWLDITLTCVRLGRSSLDLAFAVHCGTEQRLSARSTLVHVGADGRPVPWAGDLRKALEFQVKGME